MHMMDPINEGTLKWLREKQDPHNSGQCAGQRIRM